MLIRLCSACWDALPEVWVLVYRVSTKELYTLKMMHKTNAVHLELYTHTNR
jgi:hypothetical protein